MKQLKRAIMADYEIPENTPSRAVGVQFGANETLLGVADRLIDDANRTGSDAGLALVDAGGAIQKLREQDHLYTLFARGDLNDREVRIEQVIQPFTNLFDPEKDDSRAACIRAHGGCFVYPDCAGSRKSRRANDRFFARGAISVRARTKRRRAGSDSDCKSERRGLPRGIERDFRFLGRGY